MFAATCLRTWSLVIYARLSTHPYQVKDFAGVDDVAKRAVEGAVEVGKWAVEENSHMVTVYNKGAYVASFRVNYVINGDQSDIPSGDISPGSSQEVKIPPGGKDVKVDFFFVGLISHFNWVTSKEIEKNSGACFEMTGTTLNPKVHECKDD
jgi:hypothetical protein